MEDTEKVTPFHEMGLDDRILKAICSLGWSSPTLIQEKTIPFLLAGNDILAKARTGSGKTGAYIIPIVQKLLSYKKAFITQETKVVVLAPSKELCDQIHRNFLELTSCCSREVRCVNISALGGVTAHRPLLMEKPDVVISTPSRLLLHVRAGNLYLKQTLEVLVIDEADLLFSFGFEADTQTVFNHLPPIYQTILLSATLTADIASLKRLFLCNPIIIKLTEQELPPLGKLTQYHINCTVEDKYVLIYALLKLRLILGRTIIFVSTVNECYKLKLYLQQFGIRACVLNSELPTLSRCDIVKQFNERLYDIIVASDERNMEDTKIIIKHKKEFKRDDEYGIARGIDFHAVSNVINFDFPPNVDSYIHRVGRTARGHCRGTALSFVCPHQMKLLNAVKKAFTKGTDSDTAVFKPYQFKMEELEAFRYRARDVYRSITSLAIKNARMKEIKRELVSSEKLQTYFQNNPRDLQVVRRDIDTNVLKVKPHLKDIPDYIVPETLQKMVRQKLITAPVNKSKVKRGIFKRQLRYKKRQKDPLKTFNFPGVNRRTI